MLLPLLAVGAGVLFLLASGDSVDPKALDAAKQLGDLKGFQDGFAKKPVDPKIANGEIVAKAPADKVVYAEAYVEAYKEGYARGQAKAGVSPGSITTGTSTGTKTTTSSTSTTSSTTSSMTSGCVAPGVSGSLKDFQIALISYGAMPDTLSNGTSAADGVCGDMTLAAIKKFQTDKGLPATGVIDSKTASYLMVYAPG